MEQEWRTACQHPIGSRAIYKNDGWQGWGHWLGTGNQKTKVFLPFDQAHAYALSLTLKSQQEWQVWSKSGARPPNIPSNPQRSTSTTVGKDGATGWAAATSMTKVFLPFDQAHAYALSLTLKTQYEWNLWSKSGARPANIPSGPDRVYKHDGWQGWGHWLGIRQPAKGRPDA